MNDEKENTFRALKDEPLLVTSRWCKWGFHKWTRWAILNDKKQKSEMGYTVIELQRYCIHCGRLQLGHTNSHDTKIRA